MVEISLETKQGDIILLPFPFSDLTQTKVRPAIIISNDEFNKHSQDLLVCAITSNITSDKYTLLLSTDDLCEGTIDNCAIKVETILKISKTLIIKKIAKSNKEVITQTIQILNSLVNPSFSHKKSL